MSLQINDLVVESTLSASTLTATTLFVGTNSVGGTLSNFNSLSATTLSGGTIYSGGTDLYNIFLTANDGNDITRVQPGSNITTGGTGNFPTVSVVASPSFNSITLSGASSFTTLSATTFISGSTDLYNIFVQSSRAVNNVNAGSNITTGGTATSPTINLTASPSINNLTFSGTAFGGGVQAGAGTFTTISGGTVSGGTFISGGTNLYNIFAQPSRVVNNVNAGSNITTGGTAISPTINLTASPSVNNLTFSGAAIGGAGQFAGVTATSLSATTLSGGTILSGGTNLYSIFATAGSTSGVLNINAGSNIATGGTATSPTISVVASPSFNTLILSGAGQFAGVTATSLSATTLSGGTILSGSTNLYNIFAKTGSTLQTKSGTIAGSSFAGNPKKATVTFATAFASANYAITITSDTNRTWTWESKTASGFTINSNSNTALPSGNVDWTAIENGEK